MLDSGNVKTELEEVLQPLGRPPSRLRGAVAGNYKNRLPEYDGGYEEVMAWRRKRDQITKHSRNNRKHSRNIPNLDEAPSAEYNKTPVSYTPSSKTKKQDHDRVTENGKYVYKGSRILYAKMELDLWKKRGDKR